MTPNIAIVHVANPYWRGIRLWLPLFLLWIPAILLAPIVFLVLWVVCIAAGISFMLAIRVFWGLLCGLPGTDVRVSADGSRVTVRIL
jgi:hypothetical protein